MDQDPNELIDVFEQLSEDTYYLEEDEEDRDENEPSWEKTIFNSLQSIEQQLLELLLSDHFKSEWSFWGIIHNGTPNIYFRIQEIIYKQNIFPIETKTTKKMQDIIINSLISQLNLFKNIHKAIHRVGICKDHVSENIIKSIVKESVTGRVYDGNIYNLVFYLSDEYKHKWHAAEKIQQAWRTCISNPSFEICQKRLMKEFQQLI